MADTILPFKKPDKEEPYLTGQAKCLMCRYEWIAVAPVGTLLLDCPVCELETARYVAPVAKDGHHWQCACGNDLFYITPTETYCCRCGGVHSGF